VEAREIRFTAADLRAYEGYFDTLIGLVKVSGKSGDLIAEIMGQSLELMPRENGQFGVRFKLFGFIPIKIDMLEELNLSLHQIDGLDVLALKTNGHSILIGEKLIPEVIPQHLLDYVGNYEIINRHDGPMPQSVRILYEDGFLIGAITFAEKPGFVYRVALKPVADNELVLEGLGPGKGETLHLSKVGNELRFSFSGFELRKKPESGNGNASF
jgi:hypothetical protein